jgi:hypothetical protein
MSVDRAVTYQRLLYSCLFRGRCLANGPSATILSRREDVRGTGCIAPRILNLVIKLMPVISFAPR